MDSVLNAPEVGVGLNRSAFLHCDKLEILIMVTIISVMAITLHINTTYCLYCTSLHNQQ